MAERKTKHPILVPVDFSAHSEAALLHATELAKHLECSVVVLHVVHDPAESPGYYAIKGHKKRLKKLQDVAETMLSEFMHETRKHHPHNIPLKEAETELVIGLPVSRILEVAKNCRACMIVMGSQGRTGLAHVLIGSKAEQVVRLSPIPVTIVKAHKD